MESNLIQRLVLLALREISYRHNALEVKFIKIDFWREKFDESSFRRLGCTRKMVQFESCSVPFPIREAKPHTVAHREVIWPIYRTSNDPHDKKNSRKICLVQKRTRHYRNLLKEKIYKIAEIFVIFQLKWREIMKNVILIVRNADFLEGKLNRFWKWFGQSTFYRFRIRVESDWTRSRKSVFTFFLFSVLYLVLLKTLFTGASWPSWYWLVWDIVRRCY